MPDTSVFEDLSNPFLCCKIIWKWKWYAFQNLPQHFLVELQYPPPKNINAIHARFLDLFEDLQKDFSFLFYHFEAEFWYYSESTAAVPGRTIVSPVLQISMPKMPDFLEFEDLQNDFLSCSTITNLNFAIIQNLPVLFLVELQLPLFSSWNFQCQTRQILQNMKSYNIDYFSLYHFKA